MPRKPLSLRLDGPVGTQTPKQHSRGWRRWAGTTTMSVTGPLRATAFDPTIGGSMPRVAPTRGMVDR